MCARAVLIWPIFLVLALGTGRRRELLIKDTAHTLLQSEFASGAAGGDTGLKILSERQALHARNRDRM